MDVEEMTKILEAQIEQRREVLELLRKNHNPCLSCGPTTSQLGRLIDWVQWKG